jgi:hypothetical protein
MTSIIEVMKQTAQEIAEHAHTKIASLDNQLADTEKQKAAIDAERQKAHGALKRAADFPVNRGADHLCPLCWVSDGVTSTLLPAPSPNRQDIFRCNICHFETVF